MNILFILPEFYPHSAGGIATFYLQLISKLKSEVNAIKIIVGSGYTNGYDQFKWNGIDVQYLKPEIFHKYLLQFSKFDTFPQLKRDLAAAWGMFEQAKQGEGFDLVECTDFGVGYVPWVCKNTVPVNVRLHGSSGQISYYDPNVKDDLAGDFNKLLEISFFNKAYLSTYSESNKQFWQKVLPECKIHKLLPVYSDLSITEKKFKDRERVGIITGRLQYWKGPITTCKALQIFNNKVNIKWFGRDMPYKDCDSMSAYLADNFPGIWQKNLQYAASLPKDKVNDLQKKALFGLVPSTWDMFNFTCVEFMSNFTPVICSDKAGASELIINGENGFVFESGNHTDLAEKINILYSLSEAEYEKTCRAAFDTIKRELDSRELISNYLLQYKDCMNYTFNKIDPFISEIFSPSSNTYTSDMVLKNFGLKEIWAHSVNRTINKILK